MAAPRGGRRVGDAPIGRGECGDGEWNGPGRYRMTDLPGTQRAVRDVPGVARADLRWPDPNGPATLRVEVVADADPERVVVDLARALAAHADIDLAGLEVDHVGQGVAERPTFSGLRVDRRGSRLSVEVTLRWTGGYHSGESTAHVDADPLRLVAAAAERALASLAGRPRFQIIDVWRQRGEIGSEHVTVMVRDLELGATTLGTALVRLDVNDAVVRATLDAVNRRLSLSRDEMAP